MRLEKNRSADRGNSYATKRRAAVLSGFLLASSMMVGACDSGRSEATEARATVSCESKAHRLELRSVGIRIQGNCEGDEVTSVDINMPCGGPRFQQRCTLTLPVPSSLSFKRGRDAAPLEIAVKDSENEAEVEIGRKTLRVN